MTGGAGDASGGSDGRGGSDDGSDDAPAMHRFAHRAMACVFEILVPGGDESHARDAAAAAFEELDRLEKVLSRFHAYGDVGRINAAPAGLAIIVDIETTECLALAHRVWQATDGAFDVTAGKPDDALAGAAAPGRAIGMGLLEIDAGAHTVRRLDPTVQVDLGAIGKGYALDRLAEVLAEWDIASALLHSGTSTALALGTPAPGRPGWRLALRDPGDEAGEPLGWVALSGLAFSGSATTHDRHIVDPRRRLAVPGDRAAWAVADTAAEADAITTALCVMEIGEIEGYSLRHEGLSCMVVVRHADAWRLRQFGPPRLLSGSGSPEEGA